MYKRILLVAGLVLATAVLLAQTGSSLVKNNASKYRIVIPVNATETEKRAASIFKEYVSKMTGVQLNIVTDNNKAVPIEVRIGATNRLSSKQQSVIKELHKDGYWIQSDGVSLNLLGGKGKGAVYAVVSYLEDYLGCRKLTPEEEIVPKKKEIKLFPINDKQQPAAEIRIVNGELPENQSYKDWRKLETIPEVWSEGEWRGYFVHTFNRLVPSETYFEKHPEYFSMINGKRIHYGQLCLTNPDVFTITVQQLRKEMSEHPSVQLWSVSQNDNFDNCRCDACKKLDDAAGSPMGSLLPFVNKVAAEFPDKTITTLAYEYSRKPPVNIIPAKNVMITLCTIELNRSEPIATDPTSASFRADMEGWSKICSNIMIWDYEVQFSNYLCPFPLFHTLKPNIQYFNNNGTTSHFQQSNVKKGNEFAELKTYLLSKLLWNPNNETAPVIDEFIKGFYGKAAPFIKEYFELLQAQGQISKQRLDIFGTPVWNANTFLSKDNIIKYKLIFDKAQAAVRNQPDYLQKVMIARLPIQFSEMEIAKSDLFGERGWFTQVNDKFIAKAEMKKLLDSFYTTCTTNNIKTINETGLTPDDYYKNTLRLLDVQIEGNLAFRKTVTCTPSPDKRYSYQGTAALTNAVKGTDDYKINWLGWEGQNTEVVVDLGKIENINEAVISTLHSPKSWIIHPKGIVCSISDDGINFREAKEVLTNTDLSKEPGIKNFQFQYSNAKARYVKFSVSASLVLPAWHTYSGNPSWLFIDEVVVK